MPIGLRSDRSWAALPPTTANDLLPFWKRHLRAQMQLHAATAACDEAPLAPIAAWLASE